MSANERHVEDDAADVEDGRGRNPGLPEERAQDHVYHKEAHRQESGHGLGGVDVQQIVHASSHIPLDQNSAYDSIIDIHRE